MLSICQNFSEIVLTASLLNAGKLFNKIDVYHVPEFVNNKEEYIKHYWWLIQQSALFVNMHNFNGNQVCG